MLKMIRLAFAAMFLIPILIITWVIGLLPARLLRVLKADHAALAVTHFYLRFLIWAVLFFLGGSMRISGVDNIPHEGKVCFVGNHQSMMDIPSLLYPSHVWCGFVGKVEIKKIPFVSSWFRELRCVYIDRKSPRDSIKAILQGSEQIKEGYPMAIFPEGTRSKNGVIGEFKAGSFKMATRVGAKIVPVCIKGSRTIFEGGYSLLRKPVYVQYLPPIDTEGMSEDEVKEVHTIVENEIRKAYDELPSVKFRTK